MAFLNLFRGFLRIISRSVLIIAVFFTIINLFIYLTAKDKVHRMPLEQRTELYRTEIYKTINDPKYDNPEGRVMISIYQAMLCNLSGEACTDNPKDADKNFQNSMFGSFAGLITAPYANPPASGVYYLADSIQRAKFIPQAYAAEGIGFAGLKPLLDIWRAFRNLAYLILVLVIVSIGFMIMFRKKIDPQTVVGIESALPRIVITLILVTFSFAIAGFLIDLMYIIMAVMIITIGGNIEALDPSQLLSKYLNADAADIMGILTGVNTTGSFMNIWDILVKLPYALIGLFGNLFQGALQFIGSIIGLLYLGPKLFKVWNKTIANMADWGLEVEGGAAGFLQIKIKAQSVIKGLTNISGAKIIFFLVIFIGSFFLMPILIGVLVLITAIVLAFRILFMLLKAYIKILLLVMLSPLILLFGAIPGKHAFSSWFKGLFVELLTFPLFIGIFLLGLIIFETSASGDLIRLPFTLGIDSGSFSIIIGMAFMFMTPDLIMLAKKLLLPEPIPFPDVGPGVFFGGAGGVASGGMQKIYSYSLLGQHIKPLGGILKKVSGLPGLDRLVDFGSHGDSTPKSTTASPPKLGF